MQLSYPHAIVIALALCGALLAVWLWKQRRRYLAYGTSAGVSIAVTLALMSANSTDTDTHSVASVALAQGYVDFDRPLPANDARRPRQTQTSGLPPVSALIEQLEDRLATAPADPKGWSLLAQSYAYVGNDNGVESAIANAVQLGVDESLLRSQVAVVTNPLR